jgi:hypothetical protein
MHVLIYKEDECTCLFTRGMNARAYLQGGCKSRYNFHHGQLGGTVTVTVTVTVTE